MQQNKLFSILDGVESTNNYAMEQVHAGLAIDGQAWFANEQSGGRGQRGKEWKSAVGENIILSVAINPNPVFKLKPFLLSALVASVCRDYFAAMALQGVKIKWPNDIYWGDRKAGGILIENIYNGHNWQWAIIGIGININQVVFDEALVNATSLKIITKVDNNPILLAKNIQKILLEKLSKINTTNAFSFLDILNTHLYKKNETVRIKNNNAVFNTKIIGVNEYGQLITQDVIERVFNIGEVTWVL